MKRVWIFGILLAIGAVGAWAIWGRSTDAEEIAYRYAKIETGELVRSISATGQLVALTTVDVKSKAGGKVVRLAVEEGAVVKTGDLIAEIDPSDTKAIFDQADADLLSAEARALSAQASAELQSKNQSTSVRDAQVNLELARIRLQKAQTDAQTQPKLSSAEIESAQAAVDTQRATLEQLERATIPQARKDAQVAASRTKSDYETARAELDRQRNLFELGYTSKSSVERAQSALESARAASESAQQRLTTLDSQLNSDLTSQRARLRQAEASLAQARANESRVDLTKKALEEARKSVDAAEIALQRARNESLTVNARRADAQGAQASIVRSKVSRDNARVNLESTTVVAPRDGVVTMKYLEEGTIIPPGTSTFAQGTSLVQISDTTRMFVECMVDEADISQVSLGQDVRIIVEAYPGRTFDGVVQRINPAATTANNITAVKVRVEVKPSKEVQLMPGMNATCEYLTMVKHKVLVVPSQAVKRDDKGSYVQVKDKDPLKPVRRDVKLGEVGNEGVEVLEGLKEGEEVVIAEINLKQLKEMQAKMEEAQKGGVGLAGGAPGGGGRPGGGGGRPGGGARPGGGR